MRLLIVPFAAALLFGACAAATPPAPAATAPSGPGAAKTVDPASPGPVAVSPATTQLASFLTMTLTDARTGEKFTLADYKGKVTIVEGMAVW